MAPSWARANNKKIQDALIRGGVDFIDENGGVAGVRLRKSAQGRRN